MPVITQDRLITEESPAEGSPEPNRTHWISEAGGLTQFGAFIEVLQPGSRSSIKHWHSAEDEMIYVLEGEITVIEGTEETLLRAGDAATFRASVPVGHYQVRQLVVDTAVSDMRKVASSVSGSFDVVLAFDNSVPHLLDDNDLCAAFQQFLSVLRPGGVFLSSVRDYDKVQRGEPATHLYGRRENGGEAFQLRQEWSWDDPMHYQATIIIDRETPSGLRRELCTTSRSMPSRQNGCLN